jgi:hypothetical protein
VVIKGAMKRKCDFQQQLNLQKKQAEGLGYLETRFEDPYGFWESGGFWVCMISM